MACTAVADCIDSTVGEDHRMTRFDGGMNVRSIQEGLETTNLSLYSDHRMGVEDGRASDPFKESPIAQFDDKPRVDIFGESVTHGSDNANRASSSTTSAYSGNMSAQGEEAEMLSSRLRDIEQKEKLDVQTAYDVIEMWKCFSQECSHYRQVNALLTRLIRITAQVIFAAVWTKVCVDRRALLEEYLLASSAAMDREEEPLWGRMCNNIVFILKHNLWQLPYLQEIFDNHRISVDAVNTLWEAEGCVLLETRLEKLCQAQAYDNGILLAEACVMKGQNMYEKNESIDDGMSPFYLSVDKYYQFAAMLVLMLYRQEVDDDENAHSYPKLQRYLTPSFCLGTVERLTSTNANRIAPKWNKGWKYREDAALQCLEFGLIYTIKKDIELFDLKQMFKAWLTLSMKECEDTEESSQVRKVPFEEIENIVNNAAKNAYIYAIADIILDMCGRSVRSKCLELYIPALIRDNNKFESLKASESGKDVVKLFGQELAIYYDKLARHFEEDALTRFELLLTSFSLDPTPALLSTLSTIAETNDNDECKVNVCQTVSAVNKAADLGLPLVLYEGLLTVMTNPRWSRLNCYRHSWEEFKPLCQKHLETRGEDIKGVNDLELVTPDYSKYENLKPAYDENDNGYEPGYGPAEGDNALDSDTDEESVRKTVREPSHRLLNMNLKKTEKAKHERNEKTRNQYSRYKEKLKKLIKPKSKPVEVQALKKLAVSSKSHRKPKTIDIGLTTKTYARRGRPPRYRGVQEDAWRVNAAGRMNELASANLLKIKENKLEDVAGFPFPVFDVETNVLATMGAPFPPPEGHWFFPTDEASEKNIPDCARKWMLRWPSDDCGSGTTYYFCQSAKVDTAVDHQELQALLRQEPMTSSLISRKKRPTLNSMNQHNVYLNKNFASDMNSWRNWMKYSKWDGCSSNSEAEVGIGNVSHHDFNDMQLVAPSIDLSLPSPNLLSNLLQLGLESSDEAELGVEFSDKHSTAPICTSPTTENMANENCLNLEVNACDSPFSDLNECLDLSMPIKVEFPPGEPNSIKYETIPMCSTTLPLSPRMTAIESEELNGDSLQFTRSLAEASIELEHQTSSAGGSSNAGEPNSIKYETIPIYSTTLPLSPRMTAIESEELNGDSLQFTRSLAEASIELEHQTSSAGGSSNAGEPNSIKYETIPIYSTTLPLSPRMTAIESEELNGDSLQFTRSLAEASIELEHQTSSAGGSSNAGEPNSIKYETIPICSTTLPLSPRMTAIESEELNGDSLQFTRSLAEAFIELEHQTSSAGGSSNAGEPNSIKYETIPICSTTLPLSPRMTAIESEELNGDSLQFTRSLAEASIELEHQTSSAGGSSNAGDPKDICVPNLAVCRKQTEKPLDIICKELRVSLVKLTENEILKLSRPVRTQLLPLSSSISRKRPSRVRHGRGIKRKRMVERVLKSMKVEEPVLKCMKVEEPVLKSMEVEEPVLKSMEVEEPVLKSMKVEEPVLKSMEVEEPVLKSMEVEEPVLKSMEVEEPVLKSMEVEEPMLKSMEVEEPILKSMEVEELVLKSVEVEEPVLKSMEVEEPIVKSMEVGEPILKSMKAEKPVLKSMEVEQPVLKRMEVEGPIVKSMEVEEPILKSMKVEEPVLKSMEVEGPVLKSMEVEEPILKSMKVEEPVLKSMEVEEPILKSMEVEEPVLKSMEVEEPILKSMEVEGPVLKCMEIEELPPISLQQFDCLLFRSQEVKSEDELIKHPQGFIKRKIKCLPQIVRFDKVLDNFISISKSSEHDCDRGPKLFSPLTLPNIPVDDLDIDRSPPVLECYGQLSYEEHV